jgi:multimeric flavodoxin WrbA
MKVLGLVSSPRRYGNSELAAKELLRSLPDEWEKRMIRLSDLELAPCKACYACLAREGNSCVLRDDMDFVLEHMMWADKIVIAAPCYILGAHVGVQRLIGRLMPVMERHPSFAGKQCALAISYGLHGWEGMAREEMLKIPQCLGMGFAGAVMLEAIMPGDSVRGENLQSLRALAKALEGPCGGEPYTPERDTLLCPYCRSRLLTIRPGRDWRCVLCGGGGTIVEGPQGFSLAVDGQAGNHFTAESRVEHENQLQEAKRRFIKHKAEIKELQGEYRQDSWWVAP